MAARRAKREYRRSSLQNQVRLAHALQGLQFLPKESVDLIMTSPESFLPGQDEDIQTAYTDVSAEDKNTGKLNSILEQLKDD